MSSLNSYLIGYALSLLLTLTSFFTVTHRWLESWKLLGAISMLGIYQALVQLYFFLHVGSEKSPRWKLLLLVYTILILVVTVLGSLWVMHHLDYRMMGA